MATRRTEKQVLDEIESILNGIKPPTIRTTSAMPEHSIDINNLDAVDDGSGESGRSGTGSSGSGTGEPVIDLSVFGFTSSAEALLATLIRKGEAKFGWVPDTKDPNEPRQKAEAGRGPQRHPLLSDSQRFAGVDPKLNSLPTDNPKARENYQRLANELRPGARPQNTPVNAPTFKPAGA